MNPRLQQLIGASSHTPDIVAEILRAHGHEEMANVYMSVAKTMGDEQAFGGLITALERNDIQVLEGYGTGVNDMMSRTPTENTHADCYRQLAEIRRKFNGDV